jgi:signal transduction histidine kinase
MLRTLRSRLWLGYAILILLIVGAFLIGLAFILNSSTVLYRQSVSDLQTTWQLLNNRLERLTNPNIDQLDSLLVTTPAVEKYRVIVLSRERITLFDSDQDDSPPLRWLRLEPLQRAVDQESAALIRDSQRRVWIYVASQLPGSDDFLVIAVRRENLTMKFMFSDPMTRLVSRVVLWSIFIAFLLTLLMDYWIAKPIRKMAQAARVLTFQGGASISPEGVKEVKDLAEALNQMNRQVQESQQSQRDFVSDVSHELRTPLTSIQGFSNAILDGTLNGPDEIRHSAKVISDESLRMLRLVNELLTLARLEGNVEKLAIQPTDLNVVVDRILDKLAINASQSQVELRSTISHLPLVPVDEDRITQVLTNLLDNAIKFTPAGGEVNVTGEVSRGMVIINVSDTGQGIMESELSKIFNRFYQVERSRKGGDGRSSGLGLTIAREIARLHNGDITVKSIPGSGTTFTLSLPDREIPNFAG